MIEACDNYDVYSHDGTRPLLTPIYDYLERVLYNRMIYLLTYLEMILSVLCSDLNNHFHEEWNWKLKVNASLCLNQLMLKGKVKVILVKKGTTTLDSLGYLFKKL